MTVIGTIASHSALQILRGAKEEGFKTMLVCDRGRKKLYERFGLADEYVFVDKFGDVLKKEVQQELIDKEVIMVPHGSFVEYVGARELLNFKVPMFGNKNVLVWESDRKKGQTWFKKARLKIPKEFKDPSEINRPALVKYPGARGGRGYALVKNEKEFKERVGKMGKGMLIQEYIVGTRFYPHFFFSPLSKENEIMGIDIRYESNVDGLSGLPEILHMAPTYVITGNIPVMMRESLLAKVFDMADSLIKASQELFYPGLKGPYCIELVCTDTLELYLFEISARIVAGTNVWVPGSPYTYFKYGKEISTGRRIAMEIKRAIKQDKLDEIVT
ncbi:MAG TPA: formate--phosphoribosylaminoimidazolecarboxamide ligase [Thermoplasmata archaeon]|nr:formate--phosphoribosylaminoimidazolecarboxamide ligase [Thermoplasmata archaeon]